MIKNIIFDFGKVLVDYDFPQFMRRFFDDPVEMTRFANVILSKEWNAILDKEDKPFGEYMQDLKNMYPQYEKQIEAFDTRYQEIMTGEIPGMYEVLSNLKQRGFKLYGLTNWCSKVYDTINSYEIFKLLDDRIISSEEHLLKPYPEIYQCLLDRFQLKAEECIFTDDKEENILGGRTVGIDGIVFQNAQQFHHDLEAKLAAAND